MPDRESDTDRPEQHDTEHSDAPDTGATGDQATDGYDALAALATEDGLDPAASPWGDSHYQRHYAWPATVDALPAVSTGDRVLLAGCGRGDHVAYFRERGADVVGVDASETALATAREAHPAVEFHRGDLREGLPDAVEGPFDLVLSHLVFGHLPDWRPALDAFRRVLDADGTAVLTTVHPAYLSRRPGVENYYDRVEMAVEWPGGATIPVHYRPPAEMVAAVVESGLRLRQFVEPRPEPAYVEQSPERHEAAMERPEVLVLRADVD